jgi:hypothetical protein
MAAAHIRPPKPFAGKPTDDFKSWRLRLEQYFALAATADAHKLPILLLHLEGTAYRTAEQIKGRFLFIDLRSILHVFVSSFWSTISYI